MQLDCSLTIMVRLSLCIPESMDALVFLLVMYKSCLCLLHDAQHAADKLSMWDLTLYRDNKDHGLQYSGH